MILPETAAAAAAGLRRPGRRRPHRRQGPRPRRRGARQLRARQRHRRPGDGAGRGDPGSPHGRRARPLRPARRDPQVWELGVKEVWKVAKPLDRVIHTMGWPLRPAAKYREFGGSFIYPMGDDMVTIGMVVGLDYRDVALSVHDLLQELKTHPKIRPMLDGGERLEWGAKTIPSGGFHSLPQQLPRARPAAVRRRRRDGQRPDPQGHPLRDRVGTAGGRGRVRALAARRDVPARALGLRRRGPRQLHLAATCTRCATCARSSGAASSSAAPLASVMTRRKGRRQRRPDVQASRDADQPLLAHRPRDELSRRRTASSPSTSSRRSSRRATRPATTSPNHIRLEQRVPARGRRAVGRTCARPRCTRSAREDDDGIGHRRRRAVELRPVRRHHGQGRPPHPARRRLGPRVHPDLIYRRFTPTPPSSGENVTHVQQALRLLVAVLVAVNAVALARGARPCAPARRSSPSSSARGWSAPVRWRRTGLEPRPGRHHQGEQHAAHVAGGRQALQTIPLPARPRSSASESSSRSARSSAAGTWLCTWPVSARRSRSTSRRFRARRTRRGRPADADPSRASS